MILVGLRVPQAWMLERRNMSTDMSIFININMKMNM